MEIRTMEILLPKKKKIKNNINDILFALENTYGTDNIKQKGNLIKILLPNTKNAIDMLKAMVNIFTNSIYSNSTTKSSKGHIEIQLDDGKKIYIVIKPKNVNIFSYGIKNEIEIYENISKIIHDYGIVDIQFIANNDTVTINNVVGLKLTGKNTKENKKADLVLFGDTQFGISLKKKNAEHWHSVDKYPTIIMKAKSIIDNAVKDKKVKLNKIRSYYKLSNSIAFPASPKEKQNVVFGSDLLTNGAVIVCDFSKKNFKFEPASNKNNKNTLKITVNHIITSKNTPPQKLDVWFLIRNDSTRRTKDFYPGLRVLAVKKSRINKNIIICRNITCE